MKMSCNSMIYCVNTTTTAALTSGATIPLGSVSRKFGCHINLLGDSVIINGKGYYDVNATVTFTPSGQGVYTVQLYKDGVAVPGALATVDTDVQETVALTGVVRTACCDVDGRLSLQISSVAGTATTTINNVAFVVEKI